MVTWGHGIWPARAEDVPLMAPLQGQCPAACHLHWLHLITDWQNRILAHYSLNTAHYTLHTKELHCILFHVWLKTIHISAVKWLIASKIKFLFTLYMHVYCVYLLCIYKYTHIQYIFWKYLRLYIYIFIFLYFRLYIIYLIYKHIFS